MATSPEKIVKAVEDIAASAGNYDGTLVAHDETSARVAFPNLLSACLWSSEYVPDHDTEFAGSVTRLMSAKTVAAVSIHAYIRANGI